MSTPTSAAQALTSTGGDVLVAALAATNPFADDRPTLVHVLEPRDG